MIQKKHFNHVHTPGKGEEGSLHAVRHFGIMLGIKNTQDPKFNDFLPLPTFSLK